MNFEETIINQRVVAPSAGSYVVDHSAFPLADNGNSYINIRGARPDTLDKPLSATLILALNANEIFIGYKCIRSLLHCLIMLRKSIDNL